MPITEFSSFDDGLRPDQRKRGNFIVDTSGDDERLWIPYADGVWFKPCCFDVSGGAYTIIMKGLPGAVLGTHYHVGPVHGYTIRGHWRYLEHDWVARPGTYNHEPAGEAHTLMVTADSPGPMEALFIVNGALIYLDKSTDGRFAAYDDVFTVLDFARAYYREAGLDLASLDAMVR